MFNFLKSNRPTQQVRSDSWKTVQQFENVSTCLNRVFKHVQTDSWVKSSKSKSNYLVIEIVWARFNKLAACVAQRAVQKVVFKTINVCPGNWTSWKNVWTDPAWWYSHVPDGQRKRGRFDLIPWCPGSWRRRQSDRMQQQQLTKPRARDECQLGGYLFPRIFT